ncbi:protein ABHD8-like [Artemia franciscana]|uniref:acylglycerol lipase n=1 Tax=Artemia franciscana TaxID=6661 RepID=A0AA88I4V7_ARTSF|nr:hypothetical protein QYM36_003480 [Artemia franciscana]
MSTPSTISKLVTGARVDVDPSINTPSTFQNYDKYQLHIKIVKVNTNPSPEEEGEIIDEGHPDGYFFNQWARGRTLVKELRNADAVKEEFKIENVQSPIVSVDTVDGGIVNKAFIDSEYLTEDASISPLLETVPAPSIKTEITRRRSREKRIAFLIHSFGECHRAWDNLINVFVTKGFSVIAPDLIGHGYSSCPSGKRHYTFDTILENLLEIFDKQLKQFGNHALVCGSGYGAVFATAIARKRQSSVDLLILIDSGGPVPLAPRNYKWSKYPAIIFKILQPLIKQGLIQRSRLFHPRGKNLCHSPENTCLPPYVVSNYDKGQYWPAGDIGFHRRITQPCLLIHSASRGVSLIEMLEMERTLPRGYLEILSGENTHLQREIIAEFIDSFVID